jgi:photosystem II stability/assembly factor-like uncharacterized protein
MATRTKRRPPAGGQAQYPQRRQAPKRRWTSLVLVVGFVALTTVGLVAVAVDRDGGGTTAARSAAATTGLPDTPDYHSLLVAPDNPDALVLGTHNGLYQSRDGGRTWRPTALEGQDAMNLARVQGEVVWAAGHNVLAKSTDAGTTWADVRPDGLPHLDVHGFAVDPRSPRTLYAAIANAGLYRSTDGGDRFEELSTDVGGAVMALAVRPDGTILAGDMQQGLLVSDDGGREWTVALREGVMGIAVNPAEPDRIVATGSGIFLSTDGGRTWQEMFSIPEGAGPVAWSKSQPQVGYVVGFNQKLYKTTDGGRIWLPIVEGA